MADDHREQMFLIGVFDALASLLAEKKIEIDRLGLYQIRTQEDLEKLERKLHDDAIELARAEVEAQASKFMYSGAESFCPLCKEGRNHYYGGGFKWPEGLSRHLSGYGNTGQCSVTEAVREIRRRLCARRIAEAETEVAKAAEREAISRRKNEPVYRCGPGDQPLLIDETGVARKSYTAPRTPDNLEWAERRLVELGFQISRDGNVVSYTRDHGLFTTWADPRWPGQIALHAYANKGARLKQGGYVYLNPIQDRWVKDLRAKYEDRLPHDQFVARGQKAKP